MKPEITGMLDMLDLAVGSAADLFGTDGLDPIARVAQDARKRAGFLGDTVVVALVGGTGSGKSSILNALAGQPIAETGVIRPTTSRPLAVIAPNPEPGLVRLLDDLEIDLRVGHPGFEQVAVIDLPDLDSYDEENVAAVRRLLPRIDAAVWVFDPLKYNDRAIHDGFLRPLSTYGAQFLFVMNHGDRLRNQDREAIVGDLWKTLLDDGLDDPPILVTAADPTHGDPQGIDELAGALLQRFDDKQVAIAKLVEDISRAAADLEERTGVRAAGSLEFEKRWESERIAAAEGLADRVVDDVVRDGIERVGEAAALEAGAGPFGRIVAGVRGSTLARSVGAGTGSVDLPTPTDLTAGAGWLTAVRPVTDFVTDLSVDAGGRLGARLRENYGPGALDAELRDAVVAGQAAAGDPPEPDPARWWSMARYVQTGLFVAVLLAVLLALFGQGGFEAGKWPVSLLAAALGIVLSLMVVAGLRRSGRSAGRAAASVYRVEVADHLNTTIERRVGRPLRATLRARSELASALGMVKLEATRFRAPGGQ